MCAFSFNQEGGALQKRNGLRRVVLGIAGVATSLSIAGSALAASCATPAEVRAFQTRMLQTDLMLAALACGESDRYNQFIRKFTPELTAGGDVMRSYFNRAYGREGATRMNAVMTTYANNSSQDRWSVGDVYYCTKAGEKFVRVLQSAGPEMMQQASLSENASRHGVNECGIGGSAPVTTASAKPAAKRAVAAKPKAAEAKSPSKETKVAAKSSNVKSVAQRQ
jgi:hypothetical protein